MSSTSLVSAEWLSEEMKKDTWNKNYRVLDATWDLPMSKRNFVEEHKAYRIPGAKYFSLADCKNKEVPLPNTMPLTSHFESYVQSLGISNDDHIILYDNSERFGLFSAPRAWWLFQLFGHTKISILDGGLPRWKKLGLPTKSGDYDESEKLPGPSSSYKATFHPEHVKDLAFMKANLDQNSPTQVMDARPNPRFRGVVPEPAKIPSGHIPQSSSLPFFDCFDRENNIMLSTEAIQQYVKSKNINTDKDMVVSCGSGISACILGYATFLVTGKVVPLFDGSWFEWHKNMPDELQIREEQKD